MKKIFLLRHGNALPSGPDRSDRNRPLDKTGRSQIDAVTKKLISKNYIPDIIIASPALRAKTSAEIAGEIIGKSIRTADILYSASVNEYIDLLKNSKDTVNSIMVVAHNPTISEFAGKLSGRYTGMGTGNLCLLELDIDQWNNLGFSSPVISSILIRP